MEKLFHTSFKQITNWVHRFEKEGLEGLRDKEGRGRKTRLNEQQYEEVKKVLNESPEVYGYNTSTWTGPMLIEWVKNKYGIESKKAQIYNILKLLDYSYQKAKGIFPEADKDKQEDFKESLKKTSRRKA